MKDPLSKYCILLNFHKRNLQKIHVKKLILVWVRL